MPKRSLPFALAFILVGGCLGIPKAPVGVTPGAWDHLKGSAMVLTSAYWGLAIVMLMGLATAAFGAFLIFKPSTSNLNGLQLVVVGTITFFGAMLLAQYLKLLLLLAIVALIVALLVEAALHRDQIGALWNRLRGKSGSSPTP